jgi:hypothetical protein
MFYVLGGGFGGALAFYISWGATLEGYIIPIIWGVLTSVIFWLIIRPDKTHNKAIKKDV